MLFKPQHTHKNKNKKLTCWTIGFVDVVNSCVIPSQTILPLCKNNNLYSCTDLLGIGCIKTRLGKRQSMQKTCNQTENTLLPVNSSFNGTMLVGDNYIRCNLPRFSKSIASFYVNRADQILNYSRGYGIQSSSWFIIQKHLYGSAEKSFTNRKGREGNSAN